jgi:hypothetical protein
MIEVSVQFHTLDTLPSAKQSPKYHWIVQWVDVVIKTKKNLAPTGKQILAIQLTASHFTH